MMNDSYIDKIKKSFPEIELPLTEEQLRRIESAAALKPQEKFVVKSDRISEMEKELSLAGELYNRTLPLVKTWTKNGRWAKFPRFRNPYACCSDLKAPAEAINSGIVEAEAKVEQYADRLHNAASSMQKMLGAAYEALAGALETEKKGNKGEAQVEEYLSRNLNCRMLSSVVLPGVSVSNNTPKTAETDLLVFAEQGIYVCEVKNYGKAGQTLEVQSNGEFLKKDNFGRVLENMGSPFKQNVHHRRAVEKVLADVGFGDMPVYTAVIVANTDARLVNNSEYKVFDMYSFCDYVSRRAVATSKDQLQSAYNAIQAQRMTERKFPILAVSPLYETLKNEIICVEWGTADKDNWLGAITKDVQEWVTTVGEQWAVIHKKASRIDRMVAGMTKASMGALFVWYIVTALYAAWIGKGFFNDKPFEAMFIAGCAIGPLLYVVSELHEGQYSSRKPFAVSIIRAMIIQTVFSLVPVALLICFL